MSTSRRPARDLPSMVLGGALALIGAFLLLQTRGMSPLGAVFPRTIAAIMVVASLALAVVALRRAPSPAEPDGATPGSLGRRVALILIMGVWVLAFPIVGFIVSGVVAFLALLAVANHDGWEPRSTALYAATAVVVVVGAYALITGVLNLPVPRGFLI